MLSRFNAYLSPDWFIFKSSSNIDYYFFSREPTFAGSINISICDLAKPNIAPDVEIVGTQV